MVVMKKIKDLREKYEKEGSVYYDPNSLLHEDKDLDKAPMLLSHKSTMHRVNKTEKL